MIVENSESKGTLHLKAKSDQLTSKMQRIQEKLRVLMDLLQRLLYSKNQNELSYEEIYHACYKICIDKGSEELLKAFDKLITDYLNEIDKELSLYEEEFFFTKFIEKYNDFYNKITLIKKTMMYYENNFLLKKNSDIRKVSNSIFIRVFFTGKLQVLIREFLIDNIRKDRNKFLMNRILTANIFKLIRVLDDQLYFEIFEEHLLLETTNYYKELFLKQIEIRNGEDYIKYVDDSLKEEINRLNELNLNDSKVKVMKIFTKEMLLSYFNTTDSSFILLKNLIKNNSINSILLMKKISSFEKNAIETFYVKLGQAIEDCGKDIVEIDVENKENCDLYIELINNIFDLIEKIDNIKKKLSLINDLKVTSLINTHMSNFINSGKLKQVFPKILAKYIDFNFRKYKTRLTYDEILIIIEKSLNLFNIIEEKDVFETFYRRFLATKLLSNIYHEEIETKLISCIKLECGAIFTNRCEVMINDVKSSSNIVNNFRTSKFYKNSMDVDINIKVLTQGNWPVNCPDHIIIEAFLKISKTFDFLEIIRNFLGFFTSFYPGKKLSFKFSLGSVDLVGKFKKSLCFLNVSTLQAFLLILSNKYKKFSFKRMIDLFGQQNLNLLIFHLIPLIKSGIFYLTDSLNNPISVENDFNVKCRESNFNAVLTLNTGFYSKNQKIKFNIMKSVEQSISYQKQDALNTERKYLIEASIIRIMKNKKVIEHNELTGEVTKSISNCFLPNIFSIKQIIESLIEREYLKRSPKNYNTYIYSD